MRANYAQVVVGLHRHVKPRAVFVALQAYRHVPVRALVITVDADEAAETVGPPSHGFLPGSLYMCVSKQRQMIQMISAASAITSRTV